jgi:curli production assembly/transport component CsgG
LIGHVHRKSARLLATTALSVLILAGCRADDVPAIVTAPPTSTESSTIYNDLRAIPAPKRQVSVAVYSYPDLTGQFKPTETVATNSRAVTQGALWILVKALKDAGAGARFKVTQRANLENLLNERKIIRETQSINAQSSGGAPPSLPSLEMAGIILEGGIIGFDSNTVTGGIGARYLGIGGDVQYRQDTVTIYLNAISSQNGEILKSVMTRKTVASYGVQGSVFKFVAFQELLEGEAGYTINEPSHIAVTQAIEHAVRAMVIEGAIEGLWEFEDEIAGRVETQVYLAETDEEDFLRSPEVALADNKVLNADQLAAIAERRRDKVQRLADQARRNRELRLAEERNFRDEKLLALNEVEPITGAKPLDTPPAAGAGPRPGSPCSRRCATRRRHKFRPGPRRSRRFSRRRQAAGRGTWPPPPGRPGASPRAAARQRPDRGRPRPPRRHRRLPRTVPGPSRPAPLQSRRLPARARKSIRSRSTARSRCLRPGPRMSASPSARAETKPRPAGTASRPRRKAISCRSTRRRLRRPGPTGSTAPRCAPSSTTSCRSPRRASRSPSRRSASRTPQARASRCRPAA